MKKPQSEQGSAHVIIIVVLVLVVLGLLGFVFWQNFIDKKPAKSTASTTSSKTSTKNDTPANMKTYTNETLGFSFNYPSGWTISEDGADKSRAVTVASPATLSQKNTSPNASQYDVGVRYEPTSGSSDGSTSSAVAALKNGNASGSSSMSYMETINSIKVSEFDITNVQTPFFAAVFPIGSNYVEFDFNTVPTKADMTADLTKILHSVKAL
jgi:flagellar basal body-associated protein FliL